VPVLARRRAGTKAGKSFRGILKSADLAAASLTCGITLVSLRGASGERWAPLAAARSGLRATVKRPPDAASNSASHERISLPSFYRDDRDGMPDLVARS